MMDIKEYCQAVKSRYTKGNSTEHTFRADLQTLLQDLVAGVSVTNEPKRQKCGAPDYIIQRKSIPVGYIEAKDIGINLDKIEKSDQLKRYKSSLDNLILTNYLEFRFIRFGQYTATIEIGNLSNGKIVLNPSNYNTLVAHIVDFCSFKGQTIKSAEKLAKMMAQKATMMEKVLYNALIEPEGNGTLNEQYLAFKKILIHELNEKDFSDIYAQTIAYGLFAARLHDETLDNFSREEALFLIPKTNPFLRQLFTYVAGPNLDDRVIWIVNDLADIFRAIDIKILLKDFGKETEQTDPFLHFYETFLAEYNPSLRKSRGVYYTPEPVVRFIIKAVDHLLKTELNIPDGLSDTTKTQIKVPTQTKDNRTKSGYKEVTQEIHKVQILDPATGTGTFISAIVKYIYNSTFKSLKGAWSSYVDEHLIPRLNGFEILMASYAMAHLKLELLLKETGYCQHKDQRFNIYLTNSLEEHHPDTGTIFAGWLSNEANEANHIKRDNPVMCVVGNPPYSGESTNKGAWIMDLMSDYKFEPGTKQKLKERNTKWLNDDYVKFIRYGQHFVEKNGSGILAYINPHGFLDNPTFRGMRWHLLKTFDKIFIIDLHGNAKKKETAQDGSIDQNVFDIEQGVSINLFCKSGLKSSNQLAEVYHIDKYGFRDDKYDFLYQNTIDSIKFNQLAPKAPMYYMVQKSFKDESIYNNGFSINDLFPISSVGIATARDNFCIGFNKDEIIERIKTFLPMENEDARQVFKLGKDVRDWSIEYAKKDLIGTGPDFGNIVEIFYRPFDSRYTYYTGNSKGFHCMPRGAVMKNFIGHDNLGLCFNRKIEQKRPFADVLIVNSIIQHHTLSIKEANSFAPLYIYHGSNKQLDLSSQSNRTVNLSKSITDKFENILKMELADTSKPNEKQFTPVDLLDYVYATLHSPAYIDKYIEFFKIDYPKVPYPKDKIYFKKLVEIGGQLRNLHLLQISIESELADFPCNGSNIVENNIGNKYYEIYDQDNGVGKIWINNDQFFDNIPEHVWQALIGSYNPAQKWLKDRVGIKLSFSDIQLYQRIVRVLDQHIKLINSIDNKVDI